MMKQLPVEEANPVDVTIMNLNLAARDAIGNHILNLASVIGKKHNVSLMIQDTSSIDAAIRQNYRLTKILPGNDHTFLSRLLKVLSHGSDIAIRKYDSRQIGDVLWANYPRFYDYMKIFKNRQRDVKGIFDYHGVTPPEMWDDPELKPVLKEGVDNITYGKYADLAIAHSDFTKNELERACERSVLKMGYVVNSERFADNGGIDIRKKYDLSDNKVLLYVGRMAGNKRVDVTIKALANVKRAFPDVRFLCVGSIEYPHNKEYVKLKEIVRREGLDKNVIFTGAVPDEELPKYFNSADVYVTSSTHEGFCIPAVEAMACGKPVIGSACAALPEIIGDGGQ